MAAEGNKQYLVETACLSGEDVVAFVGEATRLGDKAHAARPVELAGDAVVNGASSITWHHGQLPSFKVASCHSGLTVARSSGATNATMHWETHQS